MPDAPPARPHAGRDPTALWVPLLAAVAYYWRFGYDFGTGDHDDVLPELLRRMDPALYATDPFVVERAEGPSVRTAFLLVLRAFALVLPLPVAVAVLHAAVFLATAWGVWRLARTLAPSVPPAAALATVAALAGVVTWTLGANAVAYNLLLPEALAWALALPALRLFAEGRRVAPALLLGPATWVHPLAGLLTAGALGLTALLAVRRGAWRAPLGGAVVFGGVWALAAAPGLVSALLAEGTGADTGTPSAFYLYAQLRVPHHYDPLAFGAGTWVRFGLVAAAGLAGFAVLRRRGLLAHDGFVARFLIAVALMGAVAFVAVAGLELLSVARLQVFKVTVLANVLLVVGASGGAVELLPEGLRRMAELPVRYPRGALAATLALTALTATLAIADVGRPGALYGPRAHARSDEGRIERWAREQTAPDALFVVPPGNTTFRVGARRGVTATWKAFPFRPAAMRVWLSRLQAAAPASLPPDGRGYLADLEAAYCRQDPAGWARVARALRADYVLIAEGCGHPGTRPVARAGRWAVYPFVR